MKVWLMFVRGRTVAVALACLLVVIALAIGPAPAFAASGPTSPSAAATPVPVRATSAKNASPAKPAPAKPAPALSQGKIALMTAVGGDILLLDPATKKLQKLTTGIDPAFSPDGTKLAFARWLPTPGIYVRDMKTGQERMVVGTSKPRQPTWSSDGQKLAFVHLTGFLKCRESPFGCLPEDYLRKAFGRDCFDSYAGRLCISSMPLIEKDETGIAEIGIDGTGWHDIPTTIADAQSPSWRFNSQDLLFRGNNRLQITGPNRAPVDVVNEDSWGSPTWSPDGGTFVAQRGIGDHSDIALFNGTGGFLKFLTAPPSPVQRNPYNAAPAWSPDGKTILFLTDREGQGVWKLYRMNADGTEQAPFMPDALKGVTFKYDFAGERVISWTK